MSRRLLPPDPWGITPYAQRVDARAKGLAWGFEKLGEISTLKATETGMASNTERADAAINSLFRTAPSNRSAAQKIEAVGDQRIATMRRKAEQVKELANAPATETGKVERRKPVTPETTEKKRVARSFDPSAEISIEDMPLLPPSWMRIQERAFKLEDPEAEFNELEEALKLTDALTPGNLQEALNRAEDNARRAHRLYIVARIEYEKFELEASPIIEAMRDAASKDLQGEKDRKERSKAITEADIKGRASVLFADEWAIAMERKIKAEGMMDTLKSFAELWRQRCFSLSSMLNSGKRS